MNKPIFNLQDVDQFLLIHGILWENELYDQHKEKYRQAKIEDFISLAIHHLWCIDRNRHRSGEFGVTINNCTFLTYKIDTDLFDNVSTRYFDKDLSQEWQEFLLEKYKEKYASLLVKHLEDEQTNTALKIENEIEKLKETIEAKNEEKVSLIEKLIVRTNNAKKYIDKSHTFAENVSKEINPLTEENTTNI